MVIIYHRRRNRGGWGALAPPVFMAETPYFGIVRIFGICLTENPLFLRNLSEYLEFCWYDEKTLTIWARFSRLLIHYEFFVNVVNKTHGKKFDVQNNIASGGKMEMTSQKRKDALSPPCLHGRNPLILEFVRIFGILLVRRKNTNNLIVQDSLETF